MMLLPYPSLEGQHKLKALYQEEFGMEITDEQALEILYGVMRFIYLTEFRQLGPEVPPPPSKLDAGSMQ